MIKVINVYINNILQKYRIVKAYGGFSFSNDGTSTVQGRTGYAELLLFYFGGYFSLTNFDLYSKFIRRQSITLDSQGNYTYNAIDVNIDNDNSLIINYLDENTGWANGWNIHFVCYK